ncbi:hypothetical protein AURDEDRAFT_155088 [Auricularia subglabra TFB-10046 SS5]|uniref:Uncharacterized protein n=1 Tax=Auricularia subglabra (strain TFB-10046 / SS5) TaxID=717982 RepID=J0WP28_AURST|nr:hypothetical protein AURDEDRAFT_155088 [Auricularia subglabra TFB-10046 SS5]
MPPRRRPATTTTAPPAPKPPTRVPVRRSQSVQPAPTTRATRAQQRARIPEPEPSPALPPARRGGRRRIVESEDEEDEEEVAASMQHTPVRRDELEDDGDYPPGGRPRGRAIRRGASRGGREPRATRREDVAPARRTRQRQDDSDDIFAAGPGTPNAFALRLQGSVPTPPVQRRVQFQDMDELEDDDDIESGFVLEGDVEVEEEHEEDDQRRSDAFSEPTRTPDEEDYARVMEDIEMEDIRDDAYHSDAGVTPPRPAHTGKRLQRYSPKTEEPRPQAKKPRFARFVEGRTSKVQPVFITEAARKGIDLEFKKHLPLHALADEVLEQERSSRVVTLGEEEDKKQPLVVKVHERDASYELWSTWSDRLLGALVAMRVPLKMFRMFFRHFNHVRKGRLSSATWADWRAYDIAKRRELTDEEPPDIGIFDKKLFKIIVKDADDAARKTQRELNARAEKLLNARQPLPAKASSSRAPATGPPAAGRSKTSKSTTTTASTAKETLTYDCCILCGSRAHLFNKDKPGSQECASKPLWLVFDKEDKVFKIPGTDSVACWTYNSNEGCHKRECRLRGHGHRCALCGSEDHGAQKCGKKRA